MAVRAVEPVEGQPTAVTTAGVVLTFNAPSPVLIGRFVVQQVSGDAATFNVDFSTDKTFADHTKRIALFEGFSPTQDVDDDHNGVGFYWEPTDSSRAFYAKITPASGANNAYNVRAYMKDG